MSQITFSVIFQNCFKINYLSFEAIITLQQFRGQTARNCRSLGSEEFKITQSLAFVPQIITGFVLKSDKKQVFFKKFIRFSLEFGRRDQRKGLG